MKIVCVLAIIFSILYSIVPTADAAPIVVVPDENEIVPNPISFCNLSDPGYGQTPTDMCVSTTGITFTVSMYSSWFLIRGMTPTSLIAWNKDGTIRWEDTSDSFRRRLYGVATDESYVYATGIYSTSPFLGKYDHQGNEIWNTTWDLGGTGQDVTVATDGTIVVSAYSANSTIEGYVIAFDTDGHELWHEMSLGWSVPSVDHSSNHIYIVSTESIRKYQTDGVQVWSTAYTDGNTVCARGDSLYSLNVSFDAHVHTYPQLHEPVRITRWDMVDGRPLWTHAIGIFDTDLQQYNSSGYDCAIDQNGSFVLLMDAQQKEAWYYVTLQKSGAGFSSTILLNNDWKVAFVEIEETGDIHISGYGSIIGIGVAVFDSIDTLNIVSIPPDLQLVSIVAIGVAFFDIGFIIYLKKKYPS